MNILLIGNGFDLAHGLPTKYTDFLEWIWAEYQLYLKLKEDNVENSIITVGLNMGESVAKYTGELKVTELANKELQLELWSLMNENDWIDYFFQCDMHGNENWIDFESEISSVVQSIDKEIHGRGIYEKISSLKCRYLNDKYTNNTIEFHNTFDTEKQESIRKPDILYKQLRDKLCSDLERLIRLFEIYLIEFVGIQDIDIIAPDIYEMNVEKVLSFNYTNTYERVYASERNTEYDYIHGKADIQNTINSNNMVLGVDEYLSEDEKDKYIDFIAFKKFYQRIHKQTGCKYKTWLEQIDKNAKKAIVGPTNNIKNHRKSNLYVFGHSLDVTDKDILKELILNDYINTTIFYRNKEQHGEQIANLVKVIGQDELIRRTGGSTKTIEFKLQQPMKKEE